MPYIYHTSINHPLRLAIVYSTPVQSSDTAETDEETALVAQHIANVLSDDHVSPFLIPVSPASLPTLLNVQADCIFNLVEWTGNDMQHAETFFDILYTLGLPYTGATKYSYIETSDKSPMKRLLTKNYIPTPRYQVFETGAEPFDTKLSFPLIVKTSKEHCSIGLSHESVIKRSEDLIPHIRKQIQTFQQPMVAEEFIDGRELLISVFDYHGVPTVLPIEEIVYDGSRAHQFMTYHTKWSPDHEDYNTTSIVHHNASSPLYKQIAPQAVRMFERLKLRHYARFDTRLCHGTLYVLEANTNPNLYDPLDPDAQELYDKAGISFKEYLLAIVSAAIKDGGIIYDATHHQNGYHL